MNKLVLGLIVIGVLAAFFAGAAIVTNSNNPGSKGPASYSPVVQDPQSVQASVSGGVQEVSVKALDTGGYDNQEIRVKKGIPVKFNFSAEQNAGCGRLLLIPDFGVRLIASGSQSVSATFTPTQAGVYPYRCGMNMFRGRLVVE